MKTLHKAVGLRVECGSIDVIDVDKFVELRPDRKLTVALC